jgi:hypothetical protein
LQEVEAALHDLERLYRHPLGRAAVHRTLLPLLAVGSRHLWLDLGAGGGHVGSDLRSRAAAQGASLEVVALDRSLRHLLVGRRRGHARRAVVGEASALPFRDGAFNVAFSHLLFHHFDLETNRRILAEMARVGAPAAVVDLRRCFAARLLARAFLRLLGLGPTAYHDGVVSVARSYSLRGAARAVDGRLDAILVRRFPGRFSLLLGRKPCRSRRSDRPDGAP